MKMVSALIAQDLFKEFSRFIIVGVTNTTANYALYAVCLMLLGWHYLIAGALGFLLGAMIGYILNYRWTFKSNVAFGKGSIKYLSIQLFCLCLHMATQVAVVTWLYVPAIWSQLAGIVVTTFVNFGLSRKIVFGR